MLSEKLVGKNKGGWPHTAFPARALFDKRLNLLSFFTLTPLNGFDIILTLIVYLGNPVKSSS
jgi:hypothetical protein